MTIAEPLFELELIDRIPADARLVVYDGDDAGLAERHGRINPDGRWVPWAEAGSLAESAADLVLLDRPLAGPEQAAPELARAAALLAPGGMLLARVVNAQFHGLLAARQAGQEPTGPVYTPEMLGPLVEQAGLTAIASIACDEDAPGALAFHRTDPAAAARLGVPAAGLGARLAARTLLVQALRGPAPPSLFVHTRIRKRTIGANAAMSRVRLLEPLRCINALPNVTTSVEEDVENSRPPNRPRGIYILQRPILRRPWGVELLRGLMQRGFVVVVEFDDHPNFWPDIAAHDYLTYAGPHAVQTSTSPLAEVLRRYNPNVAVFRNDLRELPPPRAPRQGPIRIFYGSLNRTQSIRPVTEAFNRVVRRIKQPVHTTVISDRWFFDQISAGEKSFEDIVAHDRHRALVAEADIVLLPLHDTEFNRCKSDLSFVEAAARGAVVLASPVVYGETVTDGQTGFIYRTPGEFEVKLERLLRDAGLRQRMGERARAYVCDHRLLRNQYRARYEWYLSLLDDKPALDRGVRERMPEIDGPPA
ncbi:MAG: glycosyltransferase [Alphaproteobacteria bacterium]